MTNNHVVRAWDDRTNLSSGANSLILKTLDAWDAWDALFSLYSSDVKKERGKERGKEREHGESRGVLSSQASMRPKLLVISMLRVDDTFTVSSGYRPGIVRGAQ